MNKIAHVFFASAVAAGCASAPSVSAQTQDTGPKITLPATGPVVPTVGASSPAAIAQARADSMRRPYTAADIEFMSGMIAHHSQAVLMASWAESHKASIGLQTFAGRIAMAQMAEYNLMR